MKKRLLLILAISISFAPAAWAIEVTGDNGVDPGNLRLYHTEDHPLNAGGLLCEDGGVNRSKTGESTTNTTIFTASSNSGAAEAPSTP